MLPARAANSLLLLTQESRSQPGHPSGMGIAIWTSHGCGQEEMDASLGSFSLTFCLPAASPAALVGGSGNSWSSSAPAASSSPLPSPLPSPSLPKSLSASLWAEHFVCKALSDATLRGAVNQRAGASPSLGR